MKHRYANFTGTLCVTTEASPKLDTKDSNWNSMKNVISIKYL